MSIQPETYMDAPTIATLNAGDNTFGAGANGITILEDVLTTPNGITLTSVGISYDSGTTITTTSWDDITTRISFLSAIAPNNLNPTILAVNNTLFIENADTAPTRVISVMAGDTSQPSEHFGIQFVGDTLPFVMETLDATPLQVKDTQLQLTSSTTGGQSNPILTLTNTNATGSVALEVFKDKPTAGVAGDVLFNQSVYGKDSFLNKQEYTRITHTLRDGTGGVEDGSIEFGCFVNGSFNNFLQINGNQNEVNCLKTLDMGSNNITTTTGDMTIQTTSSSGNGDLTITAKRELQLLSAGDDITISTASSTGAGDIDITGKGGSITTITATAIALNSTGGGGINLNSSGLVGLVAGTTIDLTSTAGAITLTPSTSVVLNTQIQMPTTSGTISYNTTTGSLSIDFASQSTGYFELGNLPASSIASLILTGGRIGGKYHILLRGQLGFGFVPSTSSTFKANNYSITTSNGNEWVGLEICFANTLSQYLVNATFYS
jgi:hypothetical protein